MITKTARETLGNIFEKHRYANMSDKDIDRVLESENIIAALGGGISTGLVGAMFSNSRTLPALAATGLGAGAVGAYSMAKLLEGSRRDEKLQKRKLYQELLAKSAADEMDSMYARRNYYNTANMSRQLEELHALNRAKLLGDYHGIGNIDPNDAADFIALDEHYNKNSHNDKVDMIMNENSHLATIAGGLLGTGIGALAPHALAREASKKAGSKVGTLGTLLGAAAGGLIGAGIGRSIVDDQRYTLEEAIDSYNREEKAYKDALAEKYHKRSED